MECSYIMLYKYYTEISMYSEGLKMGLNINLNITL